MLLTAKNLFVASVLLNLRDVAEASAGGNVDVTDVSRGVALPGEVILGEKIFLSMAACSNVTLIRFASLVR